MTNNWIVATYKINEGKRLESNLSNQSFDYYLPKITKKINSKIKVELLFPGYVFVNTAPKNYSKLKYTIGIKDVLKFGERISCMSEREIKAMQTIEETSKKYPLCTKIQIGQEAIISRGSFKGSLVKICSFSSKKRVDVLLHFLGNLRTIKIAEKDLIF